MAYFKITIIILFAGAVLSSCSRHIAQKVGANQSIYYTCPMHSEIFQTKPGHCPKCLMELVQWDLNQKRQQSHDSSHSGHSGSGSQGGGCH